MSQQTQAQRPKRPEFVNGIRVRMPEDYDFSTVGKNYAQYKGEFKLRTDAVWEKTQLKDWLRLSTKCFFFNKKAMKYQFIEPEDVYTLLFEPWGFEDQQIMNWKGYSVTGATTNFQVGLGPKQKFQTTFNSFYSMPDYYIMCAMRFEKWFKCDQVYGEDRITNYDRNPSRGLTNLRDQDHYPCFREWYQTTYSCADNILKFLFQLGYAKKAADFWEGDTSNNEMRIFPVMYDSPKEPERVTFTY